MMILLAKFASFGAQLFEQKNSTSLYGRMEFRACWLKTGCDGLFQGYPAASFLPTKT
jgi:hypothetical protein